MLAFLYEISQMKLLGAHPNIVSLVGCSTLYKHKFLVMEYVPFGDLLDWLRSKRQSVGKWFFVLALKFESTYLSPDSYPVTI